MMTYQMIRINIMIKEIKLLIKEIIILKDMENIIFIILNSNQPILEFKSLMPMMHIII
jgi:hypothetical protein